jgi:hypothetical protein
MGNGGILMFQKAERKQRKLRMALVGPSGSGKTLSSLLIASGLGKKIAVIDTEHGSASIYADKVDFDSCCLTSFHPNKYVEAITAASTAGYDVLVIDSLSHAWMGKDGELELAGNNKNSFAGWKDVRPLERRLIETMLTANCHVIVTMRSKTEWAMVEKPNASGRITTTPEKVGTAPIQTSGIEYEFDIVGDMDCQTNTLSISKSRCSEIQGQNFFQPGREVAEILKAWLEQGAAFNPADFAAITDRPAVDFRYVFDATGLSPEDLRKLTQGAGLPATSKEMSPEQMIKARNLAFIEWGFRHKVFGAKPHAENAFSLIYEAYSDAGDEKLFRAWATDVERRKFESAQKALEKAPIPALD